MRPFDGSRRVRAWPHPFVSRTGLQVVLTRASRDGSEAAIDDEESRVELGEGWRRVRVEGHVVIDHDELARVRPDEAAPVHESLTTVLVQRCAGTRLRRAFRVAPDGTFAIELSHDDVDETFTLEAQLARATSSHSRSHAHTVGAWLGSSRAWTFVAQGAAPRDGNFLDIRYQAFSKDPTLRELGPVLYRLELGDEPRLWLNRDHERVAAILSERGTRGVRARLREVVFDRISSGVWAQLFVHAVEARDDEDRPSWHDAVLGALLPEVFRGAPRAELRRRLDDYLAYDGLPGLLGLLDLALQRRDEVADHVTKLVLETAPTRATEEP